jgi:hypothetical protein
MIRRDKSSISCLRLAKWPTQLSCTNHGGNVLVTQDLSVTLEVGNGGRERDIPDVVDDIPPLSSLLKTAPAPQLQYNLLSILYDLVL